MKKFFIILFLFFLTSGCGYDPYKMPKDVVIKTKNIEIEPYQNISIKKMISKSNVEIVNKNKTLDTKKIGKHKYIISYKYKKRLYKLEAMYNVIDKTAPIFISYFSNKTLEKGNEEDLCNVISYGDNYDRKPTCIIEGNIDFNTVGTYELKHIIKDSSNNINEHNFKINIVEKINKNNTINNIEKIEFNDFYSKYKDNNNEIGIDVSKWQEEIDFKKVKATGASFVIIRIGISKDNNIELDPYFKKNIENATKNGLKVGIYFYSRANSKKDIEKEVKWITKNVKNYKLDFPIVFDWENWEDFNDYEININDLSELFNEFYNEVNKKGYKAMLYSSKYHLENIWINKHNYPVWLAHYTENTDYQGKYSIWQASNTGRINGINTDVDFDILIK